MRRFLTLLLLLLVMVLFSLPAAYCGCSPSSAPQGWGSAWWSSYKTWCRGCGGTICDYYNQCQGRCSLPSANSGTSSQSSAGGASDTPITNTFMNAMPAPTNMGQALDQGMAAGLMSGFERALNNSNKPLTPQQLAAQRAEQERERQQAIERQKEIEKEKKAKAARLDRKAFEQLSLLESPFNQDKAVTKDTKPPVKCTSSTIPPGGFICHITRCGGTSGGAKEGTSLCCPKGYPELNECNCQCYPDGANFKCMSFAACNYSIGPKK